MCQVSDKIIFCACATTGERAKNYWILHRFNPQKDLALVGEVMLPYSINKTTEAINRRILSHRLNDPSAFDVQLDPQNGDRIELNFEIAEQYLTYGFEYQDGTWRPIEYDFFSWHRHHDEIASGSLK